MGSTSRFGCFHDNVDWVVNRQFDCFNPRALCGEGMRDIPELHPEEIMVFRKKGIPCVLPLQAKSTASSALKSFVQS